MHSRHTSPHVRFCRSPSQAGSGGGAADSDADGAEWAPAGAAAPSDDDMLSEDDDALDELAAAGGCGQAPEGLAQQGAVNGEGCTMQTGLVCGQGRAAQVFACCCR